MAQGQHQSPGGRARFVKDATRFDKLDLPADERRQLNVLKTSLVSCP